MTAGGVAPPVIHREASPHDQANNPYACSAIAIVAAAVLLLEAVIVNSAGWFLLVGSITGAGAVFVVHAAARARHHRLESPLARLARQAGARLSFDDRFAPDVLFVVLYAAGIVGAAGGYAYFALTPYSVRPEDAADWHTWALDKRIVVFGYLIVAALAAFHGFMTGFFLDRSPGGRPAVTGAPVPDRRWTTRALGVALIVLPAFCWIGLPALRSVIPGDGGLASFYDVHIQVHLAAMEQVRLGARPFIEAQTQYGMGNQILMYHLVGALGFSNHGFHAVNVLLNVACVVGFFIFLQQVLGLGWALAGLVGWLVLPSPAPVMTFSGWAVLTRWLLIPVLAILLARALLKATPRTDGRLGMALVAGIFWGVGGFLSQESRTAGFLVIVLCVVLFGPASGMTLRSLARFALTVLVSGAIVLVAAAAAVVGPSHLVEAFQLGSVKSALVMAGYANSIWSTNVGFSVALNTLNGGLYSSIQSQGDFKPLFAVYGLAVLLPVTIILLARFLRRHRHALDARDREFVWKFGGVAVGAFVAHTLPLLRSDASHLYGPAFLVPIFLIMLPLFAWRCVDRRPVRSVLLSVSAAILLAAVFAGGADLGRRLADTASAWRNTKSVSQVYGELWTFKNQSTDLAARYSPIPAYQAPFRQHPDYAEVAELFGTLRDKLRGRPVELTFYTINELIANPDAFYFFGSFRSVSGITLDALWLQSEANAWIAKVLGTPHACIFYGPESRRRIAEIWKESIRPADAVTTEAIGSTRVFGYLSCKA